MSGKRGRRRKKLCDDFKERRGYCKLKGETQALCGEFPSKEAVDLR